MRHVAFLVRLAGCRLLLPAAACLALAGCGQIGPLTLPGDDAPAAADVPPAPAPDNDGDGTD